MRWVEKVHVGGVAVLPVLCSSPPRPTSHPSTSNLTLQLVNPYISALVLKPWKIDSLWQNPWESVTGAEAASHVGRRTTQKGGSTSAYLGIHADSPGSGQGLECSGGKKKFGKSDLRFQSHTAHLPNTHTQAQAVSPETLNCAGGVPLCASVYSTVKWRIIIAASSQRCWQDQIVYNLCNEFTTHSSDILIITIATIYCLVLFQGFHELSLQCSERNWKCQLLIGV